MADRNGNDELPQPPSSRGHGREVWVGIFVIAGFLATLGFLFTMTSPAMFRGRTVVTTVVSDAGGIRKGDPVVMKGVVIGRTLKFVINRQEQNVAVKLEIEGEYQVPKDSRVEIKSSGFMGQMAADVIPGTSSETVKSGDVLPGTLRGGGDVMENANKAVTKADDVMVQVKKMLSDDVVKNVQDSTTEMNGLMKQLSATTTEQRTQLAALTQSLRKSAEGLEGAATRPEIQTAIKKADEAMGHLSEASGSFKRSAASLEQFTERLNSGEGTLGKLSKDDSLYKNLNEAALNASKLMADFREHPKKYVKLSLF
jgi:phospholipid/cholesterol/gamma-HCH transport system substrate-binding protein